MALTSRTETTAVSRNGVGGEDRRRAHTVEEAAQAEEQHGGGGEQECVEVVPSGRKHTGGQGSRRIVARQSTSAGQRGWRAWRLGARRAWLESGWLDVWAPREGRQMAAQSVLQVRQSPRPKRAGVAA